MYTKIFIFTALISLFFLSCQKDNFNAPDVENQDLEMFSARYLAMGFDTAQVCRLVLPKSEDVQDTLSQRSKVWKGRAQLQVSFLGGTPTLQEKIIQYANEWSSSTGVVFQQVEGSGDIRVSFDKQSGSWSYIGTDALLVDRKAPTMNYAWLDEQTDEQEVKKIVLHEFGHALGLTHEQQHTDKSISWNKQNAYIYYSSYPNYWTTEQVDAFVLSPRSNTQMIYNPRDLASIMRYPISNVLLHNADTTRSNNSLSVSDRGLISLVYPTSVSINRLKSIRINNVK